MASTCRKPGIWLWLAFAITTASAVAANQSAPDDRGERLLNLSCMGCHDLRPIQTQALDADGWTSVVGAMVERGAPVETADIPPLVAYLATMYGPVPDGPGKKILLNACTLCHDLSRIKRTAATREEWQETLSAMLNEGAMLSDEELPVLLGYLARNFK